MICTVCDTTVDKCTCPGIDAELKAIAFNPEGHVMFKWCRKCDKHYARCKCTPPEFFCVFRGEDLQGQTFKDGNGKDVVIDEITKH